MTPQPRIKKHLGLPHTCTRHRYLSRGMPRSHPSGKTCPKGSLKDPIRSTQPSPHTQDTRQDLPKFIIQFYQVISTMCLIHSRYPFTKHHITGIMCSESKAVSRMRASSLTAGVQGNRLRQGNGSQAIYHATNHSSFA
jgi:hypothetical protein